MRHREGQERSKRPPRHSDRKGAGDDRGEIVGGRAMTETEWRTYLRAEIERLLDEASEQKLRLTLALLRAA